jgi:predicted Fe-Mo cluster-binding NifX family protein
MRIAISVDNNLGIESVVAHHFGRCPYYAFVDVEGDAVQDVQVVANPYYENHQPGAVPDFIRQQGADVMLAGGMGRRAVMIFQQCGIDARTGASGTVRRAVEHYLGDQLQDARPCREGDEAHDAEHHEHDAGTDGDVRRLREEVAALQQQIAEASERLETLT